MTNKLSWSDLPLELVEKFSERLNSSRLLIIRFRAVCKSWRACCPLPPCTNSYDHYFTKNILYLIVESPSETSKSKRKHPRSWLVMLDELDSGKLSIRYPLSIMPLSYIYKSIPNPKVLNLLHSRVFEIAHSFTMSVFLDLLQCLKYIKSDYYKYLPCNLLNMIENKVLAVPGSEFSFTVLYFGKLHVFDVHNNIRTRVRGDPDILLDDIVHYNKKIVAVDREGKLYEIEYNGTYKMNIISGRIELCTGRRKRLVTTEDDGYLYLLLQCDEVDGVVNFKVYKREGIKDGWILATTLNDHVFIVGADLSVSFPSQVYPGFQGNCIITSSYNFKPYENTCSFGMRNDTVGIFSLTSGGSYGDLESCDDVFCPSFLID